MLSDWKVSQIERMLRVDRLSQRETARRCGVSRGTVRSIATGQRRQRPSPEEVAFLSGPPRRCPECGGRVLMPCLRCQLRNMMRENRLPRYSPELLADLYVPEEIPESSFDEPRSIVQIAEINRLAVLSRMEVVGKMEAIGEMTSTREIASTSGI